MLASGCGRPDPANIPGGPQKMLMAAPSCKLDAIIADFKSGEFDGQQIGMTFAHSTVLHMIRKGLVEHNILAAKDISVIAGGMPKDEVDRAIKAFQAGKTRVVMLTYAKGGTGITLTAASTVLCVQRDWNPIANLQGMDRFYRIGSERHESINVFDYVTRGTNEIAQLRRLEENAQTLEEIVQDQRRLSEWFS
jgi:SNF2 family DNA or RNA helicase